MILCSCIGDSSEINKRNLSKIKGKKRKHQRKKIQQEQIHEEVEQKVQKLEKKLKLNRK